MIKLVYVIFSEVEITIENNDFKTEFPLHNSKTPEKLIGTQQQRDKFNYNLYTATSFLWPYICHERSGLII